jgi:hypothetical protein
LVGKNECKRAIQTGCEKDKDLLENSRKLSRTQINPVVDNFAKGSRKTCVQAEHTSGFNLREWLVKVGFW